MRRVYVDFEDHDVAERFFADLCDWLTQDVDVGWPGPRDLMPRHQMYDDASPCAEDMATDTTGASQ